MKRVGSANYIPLGERYALLRRIDTRRRWKSLDDERVCLLCERKFSGRQVEFRRDGSGRIELKCPTDGCDGSVEQWVYPTDPRLTAAHNKIFFGLTLRTG